MKIIAVTAFASALLGAAAFTAPVQAAGCLSGAAVGGVAGHVAGHHGVLGAAAGCAIGHHEAKKDAREAEQARRAHDTTATPSGTDPSHN